jgi:O-acetylserine/cysteine efflux transporter
MPLRHVLFALVVVAIWGFNFVIIKLSVEALPPILAAALRFAAAAFPAILFIRPPRTHWYVVVGFGLSFGFALYAFLNLSIAWGMPAGLASIVLQTQAFFTMLIAFLVLGDRPSRFQILGAAVAFGGIAVIASERLGNAGVLPLALTLLAGISWGVANVVTKMAGKMNALAFTVWGSLAAPIPLLALSFATERWPVISAALAGFSLGDAALIAFLAYPATLFGGAVWSWLLSQHPASVVAPFTLLVPITGLASGYLVLGETVTAIEIIGAALVIAGLGVTLIRKRRA